MKDLSANLFSGALIPADTWELLIEITMTRLAIEFVSFELQEALTQSNEFMANLPEVAMLFAKPFTPTMRTLAFSSIVHLNDNGVKIMNFFDGQAR